MVDAYALYIGVGENVQGEGDDAERFTCGGGRLSEENGVTGSGDKRGWALDAG